MLKQCSLLHTAMHTICETQQCCSAVRCGVWHSVAQACKRGESGQGMKVMYLVAQFHAVQTVDIIEQFYTPQRSVCIKHR